MNWRIKDKTERERERDRERERERERVIKRNGEGKSVEKER